MQSAPPAPVTVSQAQPIVVPLTPPARAPEIRRRKRIPLEQRARTVHYKRTYIIAVVCSAFFYLALIGCAAAIFAFIVSPSKNAASLMIGFGGFSTFLWLFSFLKRRCCHCPLCQGTPLLDNSARCHEKAVRLYPLNFGTTNVIRALVRQQFRCQYCGTPFDLLKPRDPR